MNKTTVVHIITKLELGGAQQNTLFTVANLERSKYEPVLISGTQGMLVNEAKKLDDATVYLIPELVREIRPFKDVVAFLKIRRILKELKKPLSQMIVHTHSSKAGILGRWAARVSGIHLIIHSIHGFGFHDYQPSFLRAFYILMERVTSLVTTRFIAVSKANIEKGVAKRIFTRDNTVLIRSGIDIREFQEVKGDGLEKKREWGVGAGCPLVAMIACFKTQKSPLDFVRVAKIVSDAIADVRFLLVGDGVLRSEIEALIKKLGMDDYILLLGWRNDIPEILSCVNVLVHTSLWEGLPRVFPQAMASGVPVVATKVDGAPEAIEHGINGFLVPPKDIQAMAEKVIYLIRHPKQAEEMGKKGRDLVAEFDIWKMLAQQQELYASLLKSDKER